jgi:triosephosphate isomerase
LYVAAHLVNIGDHFLGVAMRQSLVIGNWKMHGSLEANASLLSELSEQLLDTAKAEIVVCPPAIYLSQVFVEIDQLEASLTLGAQNVCAEELTAGAYTGEISALMLADLAVSYCLVGHSERREYFAESDAIVAAKFKQLQLAGICPVLCVGEDLAQRQSGEALVCVSRQLEAIIAEVGIAAFSSAVIAYEPIWAIGTGETATAEQAQEMHAHIRQLIAGKDKNIAAALRILYGGSVNADNAKQLFAMQDVDGALVGGASLQADKFSAICKAAE